jgi:hypothetical protein
MSKEKTALGLNKWDGSEKPSMGEFNEDNRIIDEELRALSADLSSLLLAPGAGSHNALYRGKSLGTSVTAAQYAAISAGTFDDMYIGDYWTIGGVNYRIAAFDYYYRCGDTDLTKHHVTLVPDSSFYNATMNATNITTGGYVGSLMYTTNLAEAKTKINAAFPGHVMTHRQYLVNAVASGRQSSGAWFDSSIEIMNELMVYGAAVFSPVSDGTTVPANYTINKTQLPLFRMRPDLISNRITYWLRDVITSANFATVNHDGNANSYDASYSRGVRPAFSIS